MSSYPAPPQPGAPYGGPPYPGQPYPPQPAPQPRSGCLTALIVIAVLLGLCCILGAIGAALFYPKLKRQVPQFAAAARLKTIEEAQARFWREDLDKDGRKDYACSLEELALAGHDPKQDEEIAEAFGVRYRFEIIRADETGWAATARPPSGKRMKSFYIDETGVLRFRKTETGEAAGPEDKVFASENVKDGQPSFSNIFED